ncbi:hypothetical protein PHYSODRAFT_255368 [Phytophthora sojae]|uniref:Retrotransposon gag domain-containing protein n=1 Tax=Phytophthora sojae (strain P6497) TaxID=1094619 RepID=G4Z8C5_PHYSP|nr:hypothetical protein PHYSODRAFT_255368 [Phytophthora sojae]EGZ21098.1 hypothetical protein PHYSODRAFT_255368 [Phytophthora sojae]|eukprot:XP_009523815.1 hypothetical protein PHYSODRAFT_255368 [Phytophthora sojae]
MRPWRRSVPAGTECAPDPATELDEGESAQDDEPAQASVGGADEVEPPAERRVSDSPQPDDEVEILDEAPSIKHEGPLSTVQEDGVLNDEAETRSAPAPSGPAATAQAPALKIEAQSGLAPSDSRGPDETKAQVSEAQAKAYVAEQVRRWEQHRESAVVPLKVEYAWLEPAPNFTEWWAAALATSKYLSDRMAMASQDAAWIAELDSVRLELCLAQDVTGIVIPPSILSPRECVALIQSLLFAAGFRFHNLILMWFQSKSSRVAPSLVRSVVEDVQNFLAFELIEWRELASGVPFKIVLDAPDVQDLTGPNAGNTGSTPQQPVRASILDYHAEDNDGDLLMSDYEAGLLGREFVLRLRVAGLRRTRSPQGSSTGEPDSKRPQYGPPRPSSIQSASSILSVPLVSTPSLSSLPSYHASRESGRASGTGALVQFGPTSRLPSDLDSSLFGTTAGSNELTFSAASGARSSRGSSPSSSLWSGHDAARHMSAIGYGPMVTTAQAGMIQSGTGGGTVEITRSALPRPSTAVDQDDVVMSESDRTTVRSDRRSRASSDPRTTSRREKRSPSPSESDSSEDDRSHHRRSSRSKRAPSRSSRSSRSGRSSRSAMSVMSGASQVALNTMRQTQEALARMELNQEASAANTARPGEGLQNAFHAIQELAGRTAALQGSRQTGWGQNAPTPEPPIQSGDSSVSPTQEHKVAPAIQSARAEAARLELERVTAEFTERWKQQEAQAEADRARWVEDVQRGLNAQLDLFQEKVHKLESDQAPIGSATPHADELLAAQLQATIDGVLKARATKARPAQAAPAKGKQDAPAKDAKKPPVKGQGSKDARDTGSGARKRPSGRRSRESGDPSGSDPDSSSNDGYDEGYSSSDSDDSLANVPTHSTSVTTQDGKTVMNFRPYVSSSSLEDFDDKAPYQERTRWWERFLTLTVQGGWTDSMKVYELRLKSPSSARNWRQQLPRHTRDTWSLLSRAFKNKYCRSKVSDSERNFTMAQKRTESALDFFYRLNAGANKVNVNFKKSPRTREMHIKLFIRNLSESRLRSSLKS